MQISDLPTDKHKPSRWGQERRLEFIDFRLLWEGKINRSDLTGFFGISIPQASLDLAKYQELAPNNLEYDRREKVYLASAAFVPVFTTRESEQYLNQLLAVRSSMMTPEMSFLGWYPEFAAVLSPSRAIEPATLIGVLRAIRSNARLEIVYQSLNRSEPSARCVSPHAIAYDGFRWHARAFCHERNDFRDFVFARILSMKNEGPTSVDPGLDREWHQTLTLVIAPHPDLPGEQRRAIELDYSMQDGQTEIECRHALLFYMLRRLRLDNPSDTSPQAQQIVLKNRDALAPYLPHTP